MNVLININNYCTDFIKLAGWQLSGWGFFGWEFPGWEFSWVVVVQVENFWVGIFMGRSCPGVTYPRWEFSLVEVFRVGNVRWESSWWQFFGWEFSCYQVDMHKSFISISRRSREVREFYLQRTVMSFVTYSLEFNFCPKFFFFKGYFYSIYSIFFRAIFQYRSDADLLQTYQKCWIFLFQFNSKYSCQPYCNNKVYNNSLYQ